ncbi:branched-chain amino acid ABC transporter ATP-binding protein [filamentous cyanobacterium CCP5]|nr:branched-chain amino acid ABC transporter ATP-binding protein [filamentous cyanobacterium CCP5]
MALQPPPPPSISPQQMNLMRVVASMAWSDGNLAQEEVDLMLDRFSSLFSTTAERQQALKEELRDYLMQDLPLNEVVPKLKTDAEKALVLRLGYEVILSSARTPEEEKINEEEAEAYQRLVNLLALPPDAVAEVEAQAKQDLSGDSDSIVDLMADRLQDFLTP